MPHLRPPAKIAPGIPLEINELDVLQMQVKIHRVLLCFVLRFSIIECRLFHSRICQGSLSVTRDAVEVLN